MKIREIIEKMESYHVSFDAGGPTCDGIIMGDAGKDCTGIVFTCNPSVEVIREADRLGYNFIICHEPTFYSGNDERAEMEQNQVYRKKVELIEKTGVVIYRNHDHLHSDNPDGIFTGVVKKLGWEQYKQNDGFMPASHYALPQTTVGAIAQNLARTMHVDGMRILGEPDMEVSRAGIFFHFMGSPFDKVSLDYIEEHDVQVIITGETVDWTIAAYVQDALALGKKRALLTPGHYNWEEPGMEYMSEWFPQVIGDEVPVKFVQSGNQYQWMEFTK